MNVNIEEKKMEAIERMKTLGIFPQTIKQFEQDGYISIERTCAAGLRRTW